MWLEYHSILIKDLSIAKSIKYNIFNRTDIFNDLYANSMLLDAAAVFKKLKQLSYETAHEQEGLDYVPIIKRNLTGIFVF